MLDLRAAARAVRARAPHDRRCRAPSGATRSSARCAAAAFPSAASTRSPSASIASIPAVDEELRLGRGRRRAVQGDPRRLRHRQDVLRALARRAREGRRASRRPRSRSPRPRRRCTAWRRSTAGRSSGWRPPTSPQGALRTVLERWGFALEEDVLATGDVAEHDAGRACSSGSTSSWRAGSPR